MKKIKCTLPNASAEISGVKFEQAGDGVISEVVSDEVAAHFGAIPGYEVIDAEAPAAQDKKAKAKPSVDETK